MPIPTNFGSFGMATAFRGETGLREPKGGKLIVARCFHYLL